MRVVAMISGGKDSSYNMMKCVAEGHPIVALANLHPKDKDELDSYMYQTVGHMGITKMAEAMDLPLYRSETKGLSKQTGKHYVPTDDDEVEDLYNLLKQIKEEKKVEAVSVGAIFSDYQRIRVENVCMRLDLVPLAYLWRRDQTELLQEMIDCQVDSIIIKVASLGLLPDLHLKKTLIEMQPHLLRMKDKYGLNVCGEGGEYETFTLNCPLFKKKIVVKDEDMQKVSSSSDPVCPVGYINFTKVSLAEKDRSQEADVVVKKSIDYLSDLNESSYSDLSDPDLSESELEVIEMENRLKETMSKGEIGMMSRSNSVSHGSGQVQASKVRVLTKNETLDGASADVDNVMKLTKDGSDALFKRAAVDVEQRRIDNLPTVAINNIGWLWISGIQGHGETSKDGMYEALQAITNIAAEQNYELSDFCVITMYVRSMADYASLNEAYVGTFNFTNPPTRVCVECPLPPKCQVIMEAVGFRPRTNDTENRRHTMHVQSISHWAPANIGPYSQSTRVGEITYISGQIALVPGNMTIIEGGIRLQCKLALRHIVRIYKVMNSQGVSLRDVVQGICFVTHPAHVTEARRQWERRTTNAIMDYIVVPALPRQALVEWQVWLHKYNDKFDYEETGCSIGDYSVSIRRRWNYENNCAAIVCYVSTGSATSSTQLMDPSDDIVYRHRHLAHSLTAKNFTEILTYTVNKLLKAQVSSKPSTLTATAHCSSDLARRTSTTPHVPAIHLKIFYQVSAQPPIDLIFKTIREYKQQCADKVTIAFTLLPACSLQHFSTFLSICGIRHE